MPLVDRIKKQNLLKKCCLNEYRTCKPIEQKIAITRPLKYSRDTWV